MPSMRSAKIDASEALARISSGDMRGLGSAEGMDDIRQKDRVKQTDTACPKTRYSIRLTRIKRRFGAS